jgi:predicted DNA binding CopG/RHH family protein
MPELDKEERALLESLDQDEWRSVPQLDEELARMREAARATARKDERVNVRLSRRDLQALRARALEEGIPYQTLIASVLHRFVSGRLVDRRGPARDS